MDLKDFRWKLEDKSACYLRLVKWWKTHRAFEGGSIPYESMPNRVFSVMREIDGEWTELYSVAVYATDSDMCWIGWITSNPETTLKNRHRALEYLYNIISIEMSKVGFSVLISKTKQTGLMRTLDKTGFMNIEPQTNFFIKNIDNLWQQG